MCTSYWIFWYFFALLQLYWYHTLAWAFSFKFAAYFQNTFSKEHLWMAASECLQISIWLHTYPTHFSTFSEEWKFIIQPVNEWKPIGASFLLLDILICVGALWIFYYPFLHLILSFHYLLTIKSQPVLRHLYPMMGNLFLQCYF